MLTDPKAIQIIANAKQKNVRDPNRSRKHFTNIFKEFFSNIEFNGDYLDLGPGQYDFGEIAKGLGANQCYAVENDPAVIELGTYLGFKVVEGNIKKFSREMTDGKQFDGVFNKFSYNCFWYLNQSEKHSDFVKEIRASIVSGGWAWIAPWNGIPKAQELSSFEIQSSIDEQISLFENCGFKTQKISVLEAKRYGINGAIANNVIFTYGL